MIAVVHNAEQRQHHGEDDSLFYAHQHHDAGGGHGQQKFAGALAANGTESAQVYQPDGHDEHDGAQHAAREVLQGAGEEEQHQRDHGRGGDVRHIGSARRSFPPWRFGWDFRSPRTCR